MIVAVPAVRPLTIPFPEPTDATAGADELHKPPGTDSCRVAVLPRHTMAGPVIADGPELTVTVTLAAQPLLLV